MMKPTVRCETCGEPVLRDEANRLTDISDTVLPDGSVLHVVTIGYACSQPRDLYRLDAAGNEYIEQHPHAWGKWRSVTRTSPPKGEAPHA